MFILFANIFDHTFNLFINNIVRIPIIDESLFIYIHAHMRKINAKVNKPNTDNRFGS